MNLPTELETLCKDAEVRQCCDTIQNTLLLENAPPWLCQEYPGSEKGVSGTVRVFGLRAGCDLGKVERHMNSTQHTQTVHGAGRMYIAADHCDAAPSATFTPTDTTYCTVPPGVRHYPSNSGNTPWVTITWHTHDAVEDVYEPL